MSGPRAPEIVVNRGEIICVCGGRFPVFFPFECTVCGHMRDKPLDPRRVAEPDRYRELRRILDEVHHLVATGKGDQRHGRGLMWDEQSGFQIRRRRPGFFLGQAEKQLDEAIGLGPKAAANEIQKAIGYLAMELRAIELGMKS